MLTPIAANARVPVGMATPYASMLLESREGEARSIPLDPFKAGLKPTDAELQQFYAANRGRYMVPEQRALRIARIGPEQVAGVTASDKEIPTYYNANKATYAAKRDALAEPGRGPRPGDGQRDRARAKAAQRSRLRRRPPAPMLR